MPVLSYLHHLFNPERCQAYIHTLRWKDRPLQCPRCQSEDVDPWGNYHYRPGCKRYWCNGCKRTFNDLTNTLLHQSKRSLPYWILATFLLCLSCSSRRIARELGVHGRTSYRWCWWLRNAALSYEMHRQLEGTVEADDLYHTAGSKGQAPGGGTKSLGRRARGRRKKREPGRGHYDKDRSAIIAWVSRQGAVVIHATRDFTVKTVQKAADLAVHAGSRLYTDSASSYRALTATCTSSSITRRKSTPVVTCTRIGRSVCFPCSSPTCGSFGASAKQISQDTWASFNSSETFVSRMRSSRRN